MKLLLNFLPMVLLYLIATYSEVVAKWSHTVLGKMLAVAIILLYSFVDIISGLLACALVIFYYQSDYVDSFVVGEIKEESKDGYTSISLKETRAILLDVSDPVDDSPLEKLEDAYPLTPTVKVVYDKDVDQFRQKHCKKGHLVHKGQIVKAEMAEHVFPEVKQGSFHKCNVCDPACTFDLGLIEKEDELVNPKSSNDWVDKVWSNMRATQPSNV
jgi:hypothetical protein